MAMAVWQQLWFPVPWVEPRLTLTPPDRRRIVSPLARRILRDHPIQPDFPVVELWEEQGRSAPPGSRRQCSPFPRARSRSLDKLGRRERQGRYTKEIFPVERDEFDVAVSALRPRIRAECLAGGSNAARPCAFIGCRYHLAITFDEEHDRVKENFPQLKILDNPEGAGLRVLQGMLGTCVLDICDKLDGGTGGHDGLIDLYETAIAGEPIGTTDGFTLKEARTRMNLSTERVRQIATIGLQQVRVKLARLGER